MAVGLTAVGVMLLILGLGVPDRRPIILVAGALLMIAAALWQIAGEIHRLGK